MLDENCKKARILIADDEPIVRDVLHEILAEQYDCVEVGSAEEVLELIEGETFNLVISDIQMPGISGLEMAPQLRQRAPETIVIMISGQQNIESAIQAMRAGAFDYITKPFDFDHVEAVVKRAIEHQMLCVEKRLYENHLEELVVLRTEELHRQISERQLAEEKVNRMAYYDSLTNLPNPTLFKDRLSHELLTLDGSGQGKLATVIISLERFKNIKDTLGHAVGEQLLQESARRISESVPKTDTTAYFGGDEFALLLTGIKSAEDVAKIAERIRDAFASPFSCEGSEVYITASLGISLFPDDGGDAATLLKNAGIALYRVKQRGGDAYGFYTADMHEIAFKRLSLETSLRRALERNEFVVFYQPQVHAGSGRITGVEALLRWKHPEHGIIPPNEFIPIAEETGLIVPLGEWVLRTACRQVVEWQNGGLEGLRIGVNLSLRQFQQPNLVETVKAVLAETGLDPSYLELELTESLMMNDQRQAIETLCQLRQLGIRISIDDFGAGYSSLAYLKSLPLDVLKIDRTFVSDITNDRNNLAIVKTIISLAQNLNLKTTAEGVETEDQAMILRELECDEMQGFLFSRPLPLAEIETYLRRQQFKMIDHQLKQYFESQLPVEM